MAEHILFTAAVTDHEDVTSSSGEIITNYSITVKYGRRSHVVARRYSEFKDLYLKMRNSIPKDYKFPNKSLFSNSAQYTKDRRVAGFDELLQLLTNQHPLHQEVEKFLGINERTSKSMEIRRNSLKLKVQNEKVEGVPGSPDSGFDSPEASRTRETTSQSPFQTSSLSPSSSPVIERALLRSRHDGRRNNNGSLGNSDAHYSISKSITAMDYQCSEQQFEQDLMCSIREKALGLIQTSAMLVVPIYGLLITTGFIDISRSPPSQILSTAVVLVLVWLLIQINIIKQDARDKGAVP
mmetsp:Transcript_28132/g.47337  ORF Transcript_28132/g.47337 Transcript_28132/m.47337 type:complete len:295 (-) Transcript_28132:136-1020(-)